MTQNKREGGEEKHIPVTGGGSTARGAPNVGRVRVGMPVGEGVEDIARPTLICLPPNSHPFI